MPGKKGTRKRKRKASGKTKNERKRKRRKKRKKRGERSLLKKKVQYGRVVVRIEERKRKKGTQRRTLGAILRTSRSTTVKALKVVKTSSSSVLDSRKILNAATSNEDNRVFLQGVLPFSRKIGVNTTTIREANEGELADSGVRLLRSTGDKLSNNTLLLRTMSKGRTAKTTVLGRAGEGSGVGGKLGVSCHKKGG